MSQNRSALFRGRHFEDVIIILCVRWYLRYSLSYRDLEEMMGERGLSVDHVTVWRWVQHYAPVLNQRLRRELRHPNRSWRVDETYVRVAGEWTSRRVKKLEQPVNQKPAMMDGSHGRQSMGCPSPCGQNTRMR